MHFIVKALIASAAIFAALLALGAVILTADHYLSLWFHGAAYPLSIAAFLSLLFGVIIAAIDYAARRAT